MYREHGGEVVKVNKKRQAKKVAFAKMLAAANLVVLAKPSMYMWKA